MLWGKKAALARLEALENDNAGIEAVEINDDDEASLDEDDQGFLLFFMQNFMEIFCSNHKFCVSTLLTLRSWPLRRS